MERVRGRDLILNIFQVLPVLPRAHRVFVGLRVVRGEPVGRLGGVLPARGLQEGCASTT